MRRTCHLVFAFAMLEALGASSPTKACSLCPGGASSRRNTLGMEYEQASIVFYGQVAGSRLNVQPGAAPGSGTTDLLVERTLKDTAKAGLGKALVIDRFVPVLDAKNPSRMLFFADQVKGKLDVFNGRQCSSALLAYLEATVPVRAKSRVAALVQYAGYLNHADRAVAEDAFHEFARSKDEDVGQVGKALSRDFVRKLVEDARDDPDRLSLFAFLLGACGNAQDAKLLRSLAESPHPKTARAMDGILGGYIQLDPKDGWYLTYKHLTDRKQSFDVRYAAVRTMRFFHGWQPKESRAQVLHGMNLIIPDGDMADFAIEDLRQWQIWDSTKLILEQHGKRSHAAPIVRRSIIRYALCCPLPEAREFVARVRRSDPETVKDLEEYLQIEKK